MNKRKRKKLQKKLAVLKEMREWLAFLKEDWEWVKSLPNKRKGGK